METSLAQELVHWELFPMLEILPKLGKTDKGWLKQEKNAVDAGKRTNMRNPPGKDLGHERGCKGYSYKHSKLQNKADHKTQHKYDNNGKKNKERPLEQ